MKKLFLLPVILLFTAATYGPPFSVSDFSSLTNRPNPSSVNPVGVVLGKTNAYDGNGGIFVFTPSSTNAVDDDIYLTTTTTGRWVRLTRDLATIQSPLVLSNGILSLAALTNYFTFLAGTNMQVTVTSNTVTYAMTNTTGGGSGNLITVNGGLVTNFWDNGYITFLNAGGGDYSLNIGDDTISTNKINSTFYNWVLSLSGGGGGTTNGLGVNGTFRTDWNAISSAEIAYTVSAGTNWYGSLVAGSVAANKLATTGTGTSTNFLAGDYSYKQVTTNMIPGLNAVLATIGTGGSGGESNTASNLGTPSATNQGWYASKSGVDLQFRSLQIGPNLTLTSNANSIRLDVTLSTNSGTVVSVDGGSSLATVNFADSTGIAASLSTTNASFALVDRAFGEITVSSSGTVMTINNSAITSNKVAAANITQDKLGTSGTGLSTNFLAGDYSYKQVTTNMIPGLNAILATIGTGGSGGGTNIKVNGTLVSNANLVDSSNALFNVSGSDISLTITNVPGTTTDNVLQWLGSAYFIVTNNSTIGNFSTLQTNGIVYNATVVGAGENDAPLVVELSFPSRSTNYIWTFRPEGDVNGFVAYEAEGYRTTTSIRFKLHEAAGSTFFTGGYWMRFDLYDKASVGGSGSGGGGDVYSSSNNVFTGSNTFSGTTTFNNLSIGTITVVTNLTVPNNAYGAGWNGSTNVPNENSVYDEMELRAPKASPAFTTSATIGGTNVLDYAATHLTESEASALYQRTNSTLTRVAGIGAGTTGDILYRDATGWTNLAKGTPGQYLAITATVPAWSNVVASGGSGDFVGPASSTTNAVVLFDGTTGKLGKNSVVTIDGSGNVAGVTTLNSFRVFRPSNGDLFSDGYESYSGANNSFRPWSFLSMASGTAVTTYDSSASNDPFKIRGTTAAGANSGIAFGLDDAGFLLAGGEISETVFYIYKTNSVVIRAGFQDQYTTTEPVDGAYIEMSGGVLYGRNASNSSRTSTSTSYVPVESSTIICRGLSVVSSDASYVTHSLFTNGVIAWSGSVTGNVPTGAGRYTGHGIQGYFTGSGAGTNVYAVGALGFYNGRTLAR